MKKEKRFWIVVALVFVAILVWHITSAIVPSLAAGFKALTPFLLAFITAYLLRHPVMWMEKLFQLICGKRKFKWQHTVASLLVLIVFYGLFVGFIVGIIPSLLNNITDFIGNLPGFINEALDFVQKTVNDLSQKLDEDTQAWILEQAGRLGSMAIEKIKSIDMGQVAVTVTSAVAKLASFALDTVLYIVASFMLLYGYDEIKRALKRCLRLIVTEPDKYDEACDFLHGCDVIIEKYVVVRLVTSVGIGIVSYIGFLCFGLPYSLLLAVIIALTNLVPYIGPFIGAVPVVLIALATKDVSTAIWVSVFMLVIQQVEGNVITPLVTSDALDVNPILVLIGIAVFGAMMGIPGMVLGAPFVAIISGLIKQAIILVEKKAEKKAENEETINEDK